MKNSILAVCMIAAMLFSQAVQSKNIKHKPLSKTFVLVHGAWQAPYAWENVKAQLEKKGFTVVIVELPGHGADQTDPSTLSINAYRDKVVETINALPGKVILVGHSMAGMVVSATAEQIPDKIEKLV